jgi:hypothetical protein
VIPSAAGAFERAGAPWQNVAPAFDKADAAKARPWQVRATYDESILYIRIESSQTDAGRARTGAYCLPASGARAIRLPALAHLRGAGPRAWRRSCPHAPEYAAHPSVPLVTDKFERLRFGGEDVEVAVNSFEFSTG